MTNSHSPIELSATSRWLGFAAMCVGMFMAILDIQIVATSLPAIKDSLKIDADRMSWIQTSYLIAEVIAIPLTGLLSRALSIRGLFLIALSLFCVASLGCALSPDFETLIAFRILQGLSGGCLIPLVFSAVFLLFPVKQQALATTLAGVMAVLAPTLGPTIGGYITETYSWPWLFLVNIGPGALSLLIAARLLKTPGGAPSLLKSLDIASLLLLALSLASLEIALKQGPELGWRAGWVLGLLVLFVGASVGFCVRTLHREQPLVDLGLLKERNFAIACVASFLFGIGLFGSVYMMPVFLGLVRGFDALAIGLIMLVTGIAQLISAPLAVQAEKRFDPRWLTTLGFAVFAAGLGASAFETPRSGYEEMFWPQVLRGAAIMFCLLPVTRIALGNLPEKDVPDGSALFNLMRNLGGAIGIALIDTVIWQRSEGHGTALGQRLLQGDREAADFVGIPYEMLPKPGQAPSQEQIDLARPLLEKAGLTMAINEAWALVAALSLVGLLLLPLARKPRAEGQ